MRLKTIIIILILGSLTLNAEWEKTEKGAISQDSLIGKKRYIPEENALVVEGWNSVRKFDLTTGEVVKEVIIDDTTHKSLVASNNLEKIYLLYDNSDSLIYNDYRFNIIEHNSKDTLLSEQRRIESYSFVVAKSRLFLLNNSVLMLSISYYQDYYIWKSNGTFSFFLEFDSENNVVNNNFSYLHFDRYSKWNPNKNVILSSFSLSNSAGKHGGSSESKLIFYDLNNYSENTILHYAYLRNEGSAPMAHFYSYALSNDGQKIYTDHLYYDVEYDYYEGNKYNPKYPKLLLDNSGSVIKKYSTRLGNFVQFSSDDKWLISTSELDSNTVEFKVSNLEGLVIFTDTIPNVSDKTIIHSDDFTFYFESHGKILKYNPFDYNLTNVEELNSNYELEIFPNPASDIINISFDKMNKINFLEVLSINGKLIKSLNGEDLSNYYSLDISGLEKGIYFIKAITESGNYFKKFVKY